MLIIPIKKLIWSILISWNLSIFISIFNLLTSFIHLFDKENSKLSLFHIMKWILLLHKCSIWIPIFGHLSNVYRTQFLDRSQPGERTIYTNRLWTRTSVVSWSTRAKREFQERVVDSSVAMRWPRTLSLTILSLFLHNSLRLSVFLATCF